MPRQTRQRIIHILEHRDIITAHELSRMLQVTPSNIRHHLAILVHQGSLEIVNTKSSTHRGRPPTQYALSRITRKDNLDLLARTLLTYIFRELPADSQNDALRYLAQNIAVDDSPSTTNITQRLYSTIKILNSLNYQAHWEAHTEMPRIILSHCPYLSILDDHPEICRIDTYFIEHLTRSPVEQIAKRINTSEGHHQCIFRLTKK